MDLTADWKLTSDLQRSLLDAGYAVSERQLERRRNAELLPKVKQQQVYKGSITRHPPEMASQELALERCLGVKERFDFAGPLLWAAGYEVGERYYAARLEKSDRLLRAVMPYTLRLLRKIEAAYPDRTLGDMILPLPSLTGILAKVSRQLSDTERPIIANVLADIAAGEFESFHTEASAATAAEKAFRFGQGSSDQVLGAKLRLSDALEGTLREISQIQAGYRLRDFSPGEIGAARDNVRNALKIAICLYDAFSWIYGPDAFGLRFPAFLAKTAATQFIFIGTLGIARLRKSGAEIYSSDEIARLANQAECTWLISTYFRDAAKSRPDLAHLIDPKKIKRAFSARAEHQKMLKELETYQFPAPEFRPWNSWQKLAKKKMTPGLLVMSIGSPEYLPFEKVVASANGSARR